MKKNIFILILFMVVLSACEDYLEKQPLDQLSQEVFWKSKSDFDIALAGNYRLLQKPIDGEVETSFFGDGMMGWDMLTDNSYGKHGYGKTKEIVSGNISPSTGGYIEELYNGCYSGVARANLFLRELAAYVGDDMSQQEKNVLEGEARFIRSFYYFYLYMFYGEVPLVLEPLTLETQVQPKVTADKILEQVLSDLDFAIANLNSSPYYENNGHVAKSTAQAFKARVLIFEAYGNTGTPNLNMLTEVRDLCAAVIPLYSLSTEFNHLFWSSTQRNNPEIIWAINYLAPSNTCNFQLYSISYVAWNPLQNLVDDYECIDGLPYGESPLTNTDDPYENRDPRLKKSIYPNYVYWDDGTYHIPEEERLTGYGIMKYLNQKNVASDINPNPELTDVNSVVIRLAEVLLMYAEAQNEIAGPDESVYQSMEDLRARVEMPPYPEGLSKEQMRERIRHERRVELAFEQGLRYFDLKRWRIASEVLNNVTDGIIDYHFEERFYKWPLPETEIEKSNGILVQNPDYD